MAYWAIGVLGLSITLFVGARALTRLLFANAHLELDAGERRIMAMTYLSLLRKVPDLKTDTETLTRVLTSLFRHSSSGLIKDDAGPEHATRSRDPCHNRQMISGTAPCQPGANPS